MLRTTIRQSLLTLTLLALVALWPASTLVHGQQEERLIVSCSRPCTDVVTAVQQMGGQVTYRYANIDAVAVNIPQQRLPDLVRAAGPAAISKDVEVARPRPVEVATTPDAPLDAIDTSSSTGQGVVVPANYEYNNALTGAATLHAQGRTGQGIVVAVIDAGTANSPEIPALGGSVIGGETFVPAAIDPLSATHSENDWHGTAVGTMIAGHAAFVFTNTARLVQALNAYAPGSAVPCPGPPFVAPCTETRSIVPMTGTAPDARLYALKVFPAFGAGSPESRIIAAMDRAITLRRNFNQGVPPNPIAGDGSETNPFVYDSLEIDVVNMSLGGPTLFAGRDLTDQLTLQMLEVGITLVTAAGNDGFGAATGGSPGTGLGSLTVGAATTAVHERVVRDNALGVGLGALFRPTTHTQTAYFSSRGPTADGRLDPDVSANGFGSYVHAKAALTAQNALIECRAAAAVPGTCLPRILLVSGTSFSSPTVAGAAALLRGEVASATAVQVRNALHFSANPAIFGDGSGPIDRGEGFLDVPAALNLLSSGTVSKKVPDLGRGRHGPGEDLADDLGKGGRSVALNLASAGFAPIHFRQNQFTQRVENLLPGQVAQFLVPSDPWTSRLMVQITDVAPELPPAEQNQIFGDDILFTVIDAPTSVAVTRALNFAATDTTTTVDHPQTGLVRVALQGDWTNAGRISATVTITRERSFNGFPSTIGLVTQDDMIPFDVDVPAGVAELTFEVAWLQNWSRYPTNDIDMILIDPNGNTNEDGATINSPERVTIASPLAGTWRAVIVGFTIFRHDGKPDDPDKAKGRIDLFTFQAQADGKTLRARR